MSRWVRLLTALVLSLLLVGSARPALAGPSTAASPTTTAPAASPNADAAPVVPHDVLMSAVAQGPIPPLPPGYVTKDLGWLELSYPPAAAERVASLIEEATSFKAELVQKLGQPVLEHLNVRVAPTFADMERLAPTDAALPEYASGVAFNGRHLVLLSLLVPRGAEAVDLDEVFRHELVHVALEDAVGGRHIPAWFNEGLAMTLSNEPTFARQKTLWDATLSGTLIPLADLDRSFPTTNFKAGIAYAESADFMRHLTKKSDRVRFTAMIGRLHDGQSFDRAVADAYGSELRHLEFEWRADLERRFSVIPALTGGGIVWIVVMAILVAAYVRRRRRAKAILARWAREEAIEDARMAARLAAERAARESSPIIPISVAGSAARVEIKVERDGGWHTLH